MVDPDDVDPEVDPAVVLDPEVGVLAFVCAVLSGRAAVVAELAPP